MSIGIKSGVHCTRPKSKPAEMATVRTNVVFPNPGADSNKAWPPASNVNMSSVTGVGSPTMCRSTSERQSVHQPLLGTTHASPPLLFLSFGIEQSLHGGGSVGGLWFWGEDDGTFGAAGGNASASST